MRVPGFAILVHQRLAGWLPCAGFFCVGVAAVVVVAALGVACGPAHTVASWPGRWLYVCSGVAALGWCNRSLLLSLVLVLATILNNSRYAS